MRATVLFLLAWAVGFGQPVRTGVIAGIVVDEAGAPVSRALLGLTSVDLPGARTTISGADGRFFFSVLPAGRFQLAATKPFHQGSEYGQRFGGDLPVTIRLTDGQHLTDLRLRLPRTASIRGRFVDEAGKLVLRGSFPDGPSAPEIRRRQNGVLTNDFPSLSLDGPGGFVAKGLGPGTYELRGSARSPIVTVTLGEGDDVTNVVVPVISGDVVPPTARIVGTVLGPEGIHLNGVNLRLVWLDSDPPNNHYLRNSPRPDDQGRFVIDLIPRGRYVLFAHGAIFNGPTFHSYWASSDIIAADESAPSVRLSLQPGVLVQGRVVFEGSALTAPPFVRTSVSLVSQEGPGSISYDTPGNLASQVFPDGTFTIWSVPPGRYSLRADAHGDRTNLMEGWRLESALLNGVDILDQHLVVGAQNVSGITLRATDEAGMIEGEVTGVDGASASDRTIVVFPVDSAAWLRDSRKIRAVRPDTTGVFVFSGLPGGDYFVAASSEHTPEGWFDPKVLTTLRASATRVTITVGAPTRISLIAR